MILILRHNEKEILLNSINIFLSESTLDKIDNQLIRTNT